VQAMSLVLLIFGLIAMTSDSAVASLVSHIPGTSKIETMVNIRELTNNSAIYFIILGLVIGGVSAIGFCAACCGSKWMMCLVSKRPLIYCSFAAAVTYILWPPCVADADIILLP